MGSLESLNDNNIENHERLARDARRGMNIEEAEQMVLEDEAYLVEAEAYIEKKREAIGKITDEKIRKKQEAILRAREEKVSEYKNEAQETKNFLEKMIRDRKNNLYFPPEHGEGRGTTMH